jgi:hypothetical protein
LSKMPKRQPGQPGTPHDELPASSKFSMFLVFVSQLRGAPQPVLPCSSLFFPVPGPLLFR